MKKILIITFAFLPFLGLSWEKILKENGGFFGYKRITYHEAGPNSTLACADPGRTSCSKANALVSSTSGGSGISDDIIQAVDRIIEDKIRNENLEGSFVYSSYFVKYQFNVEQNKLEFIIYTELEAHELGLN